MTTIDPLPGLEDVSADTRSVQTSVFDGADQFSAPFVVTGAFSLSVVPLTNEEDGGPQALPTFDGTVTLQRAFLDSIQDTDTNVFVPPTEDLIWNDVNTYTVAEESQDSQPGTALLRAGIKAGDYTAGKVMVRLTR